MKNTLKLAILAILAWVWLPTGDPTDYVIIPGIIQTIGFPLYVLLSTALSFYLYKTIPGKTLTAKFAVIKREIREITKKIIGGTKK